MTSVLIFTKSTSRTFQQSARLYTIWPLTSQITLISSLHQHCRPLFTLQTGKVNPAWNALYPGIFKLLHFFEVSCSKCHLLSRTFCYIDCQLTLSVLPSYYVYQNMNASCINYAVMKQLIRTINIGFRFTPTRNLIYRV